MKCPNCGETIKKDFLYCDKCGEEIRIVPDFEPEIENSINETLSAVVEDIIPTVTENEATEEVDDEFALEPKHRIKRRILIAVSLFCLLLLSIFASVFARNLYLDNYYVTQVESANLEYSNKNYEKAAEYYENALKMESDNTMMVSYADCLYEIGKTDQALSNYYAVIEEEPENELAYARIIAIYEKEGDYEEINRLLSSSNSFKIQTEFQNYMTADPVFSYESGTYNHVIPLKIQAPTTGTVYYTMNGTDPLTNGLEYTSPLFLQYGEYNMKAVYVNDFGLAGEVVEATYTVEGTKPEQPQIMPESGQYNLPQMISVTIPQGCTVYYTTDGSAPDENDFIYGEPIPMKEGVTNYRFVALSADGVYSDVTARSYQLTVESNYSATDSVYHLMHRLIQREMILDMEGNLPNQQGKNIYVYNSVQIVQDRVFHVIYEYYQEGDNVRHMTGNVFGVDVSNGYLYQIITDENGVVTLDPI